MLLLANADYDRRGLLVKLSPSSHLPRPYHRGGHVGGTSHAPGNTATVETIIQLSK